MLPQKIKGFFKVLTAEVTGAGSLGVFWNRQRLTVVQLQKGFTSLEVTQVAHFDLAEGGLKALTPKIKDLLSVWGLENPPVSLTVSPKMGFVRQVTLPRAARENLPKVLDYELDRFLPLGADQLCFDFQIAKETETHLTLTLLAFPKTLMESWLNLCQDAGLKPVSLELAPTAVANAFAQLEKGKATFWLLYQTGDRDFDFIGIEKHAVRQWHSERIPPGENFFSVLKQKLENLLEKGSQPATLFIYGPQASEIKTWLADRLSFPVVDASGLSVTGLELKPEGDLSALPALGAALRGVGQVPVRTNLLPESQRAVVKLTGLFLTRVLLILLLSLSVLWMASIFVQKKIALWQIERQLAQLRPAVQQVEEKLNKTEALRKQLQDIHKVVEQYPNALVLLKELTEIIPNHTHLNSFRLKKRQIEIAGRSASAADLISILEKSGYFTKTEFVSPIVSDDTGSEIFKIKAEIKGSGRSS